MNRNDMAAKATATSNNLTAPQVVTAISMLADAGFTVVPDDQLLLITAELSEHPDDYDGPCDCRLCLSYADD